MDRQELQSRRAANQIWNGAGRYDVPPEQAAFDADGDPRLYMNTIIGLASRDYDFTRFQPMLHTFEQQPQGGVYADVFWMGLENALYEKEAPRRPVLTALRQEYARALLAEGGEGGPPLSPEAVRRGWAQRVLGLPQDGDASLRALLDGLAFSPDWDEQAVTRRTEELLYQYFHRARRSVTDRQWAAFAGRSLTKGGGIRFVKPNALRALSHTEGGGTGGVQTPRILSFLQGRTPEPILRRYVEDCFGVSMLTPSELAEAERLLCTGPHRNCRLHPGHAAGPSPQPRRRVGRGALPAAAGQKPRLLPGPSGSESDDAAPADSEAPERPAAAAGRGWRSRPQRPPAAGADVAGRGAGR